MCRTSPQTKVSPLPDILGWRTGLHVKWAEDGEIVEGGTVDLAPPDRHLALDQEGRLSLSSADRVNFWTPAIDVLFESAAHAYRRPPPSSISISPLFLRRRRRGPASIGAAGIGSGNETASLVISTATNEGSSEAPGGADHPESSQTPPLEHLRRQNLVPPRYLRHVGARRAGLSDHRQLLRDAEPPPALYPAEDRR